MSGIQITCRVRSPDSRYPCDRSCLATECLPSTEMMDWAPFEGTNDIIQDNSLLGGEMATNHLIACGYRKIACIAGPQNKTTARHRLEGYRNAMRQLLTLDEPPHTVFAGNDAVAVGVYQALYQVGLSVPQDMAVMGYDDIELAKYLAPLLSTIHQPKNSLGELAINRLQNRGRGTQVLVLTPKLVERASVSQL